MSEAPFSEPLHGGAIASAARRWGGTALDWLDLSTGLNPYPWPYAQVGLTDVTRLPDEVATQSLIAAARRQWPIPDTAGVLVVPGTSAAIARLPDILPRSDYRLRLPAYGEYARSFARAGWQADPKGAVAILLNPNNPDGQLADMPAPRPPYVIIDETFGDLAPETSQIAHAAEPGVLVLKGLGKFWGLAGLRVGLVIGDVTLLADLADLLGPWPVAGPSLAIGTAALNDLPWAADMRVRLHAEAAALDHLLDRHGLANRGGTALFRYRWHPHAENLRDHLAAHHILVRIFPETPGFLRFGLPPLDARDRLAQALDSFA